MNEELAKPKYTSYPPEPKKEAPASTIDDDLYLYRDGLRKAKQDPGEWWRLRVMIQSSAYSTRSRLEKVLRAGDPHWELRVSRYPGDPSEGALRGLYARYRTDEQMGDASENG